MSPSKLPFSLAAFLALLAAAAPALADDDDGAVETSDPDDPWAEVPRTPRPASAFPWFWAIGAGVGVPTISAPDILSGSAAAPAFTIHGGYTVGERFTIGFELAAVQTDVGRDTIKEPFRVGYSPQAGCQDCAPKPRGAEIIGTPLVFSMFGARVEYSPFSRDGLFIGGTAGLAFMVGLEPQSGLGVGGRLGYRLRATNIMTLSIEAGLQGQLYGDTTMYMPYGVAVIRPYF